METLKINIEIEIRQMHELSDDDRQLVEKAKDATGNSYSPYSHFKVGAALRLANGITVIGANQENAAYSVTTCAERSALYAAQAQHSDQPVIAIAIAARSVNDEFTADATAPCGVCRQAILEVEDRYKHPIRILLYSLRGVYVISSIRDIMPLGFVSDSMEK